MIVVATACHIMVTTLVVIIITIRHITIVDIIMVTIQTEMETETH